jgi:hypothetical protein
MSAATVKKKLKVASSGVISAADGGIAKKKAKVPKRTKKDWRKHADVGLLLSSPEFFDSNLTCRSHADHGGARNA